MMKAKKRKKPEPRVPIPMREHYHVDVSESRTLRVLAESPEKAHSIAVAVMADCYPQTSFLGEPKIVTSFAHAVKVVGVRMAPGRMKA